MLQTRLSTPVDYKKAAKRAPARPRPSAGSRMPAAALLVVVEEPELVVLEPEEAEDVGELTVKVPLVLAEAEPVPTRETPVPAGGGLTTTVVLAGSVAAAGWVVTAAGCVVTGSGWPVGTPSELVWVL